MLLFLLLIISIILDSFLIVAHAFNKGAINICNADISDPNCEDREVDSKYECTQLLSQSQSDIETICGCSSSVEANVIIIIDASNHTRDEWQNITLQWLELYYDKIYSSQSQHMQVYYMLSHGDFTLTALNTNPAESYLAADSFIDNLDELSKPNACVAFKRANEWLMNQVDTDNDTAIIYWAKATVFAPSFLYYCRDEDDDYKFIRGNDIFAIKYDEDINLNYIQRDIGEFAYEMSIFPMEYNNGDEEITITGRDNDYQSIGKTEEIVSSIVAAISDFVCTKGRENENENENENKNKTPTPTTSQLIVAAPNENIITRNSDCCSHASGIEYNDIDTCDGYKIDEIEYILNINDCLFYCDPFHYYLETNIRNWQCIENYALWVQYYHICNDLDMNHKINSSMYNDYKWHCPQCYNTSINEYKSVCTSVNGQKLLDAYISENCDCKDITLFLVIVILIAALLSILIGMFILWYRFNIYKINQHLREKRLTAINQIINNPEEVVLNDITSDALTESDNDNESQS